MSGAPAVTPAHEAFSAIEADLGDRLALALAAGQERRRFLGRARVPPRIHSLVYTAYSGVTHNATNRLILCRLYGFTGMLDIGPPGSLPACTLAPSIGPEHLDVPASATSVTLRLHAALRRIARTTTYPAWQKVRPPPLSWIAAHREHELTMARQAILLVTMQHRWSLGTIAASIGYSRGAFHAMLSTSARYGLPLAVTIALLRAAGIRADWVYVPGCHAPQSPPPLLPAIEVYRTASRTDSTIRRRLWSLGVLAGRKRAQPITISDDAFQSIWADLHGVTAQVARHLGTTDYMVTARAKRLGLPRSVYLQQRAALGKQRRADAQAAYAAGESVASIAYRLGITQQCVRLYLAPGQHAIRHRRSPVQPGADAPTPASESADA